MDALAELVDSLPAAVVATDPATVEGYRFDCLMGHNTRPDAVLLVLAALRDVLGRG